MQNQRLEPAGVPKPSKTRGLMAEGPDFTHQEAAGRVCVWVWNQTDLFLRSKLGLPPGYLGLLLTLPTDGPPGRRADNPPNWDWFVHFHRTVPELTVLVY